MKTALFLAAALLAAEAQRPLEKVTAALKSRDLDAILAVTGPELEQAKAQASDADLANDGGASKAVADFQELWVRCRRLSQLSANGEVSVAAAEWAEANLSSSSYDRFMSREQKLPPPEAIAAATAAAAAQAASPPAAKSPAAEAPKPAPEAPKEAPPGPRTPPSKLAAAALFLGILAAAGGGYWIMERFKT